MSTPTVRASPLPDDESDAVEMAPGTGESLHFSTFPEPRAHAPGAVVELAVQIEHVVGQAHTSDTVAGLSLAVPVAAFLLVVWFLIIGKKVTGALSLACPAIAVLVAAAGALPTPPLVTTAMVGALVAGLVIVLTRGTNSLSAAAATQ